MKKILLTTAALLLSSGLAFAQAPAPATPAPAAAPKAAAPASPTVDAVKKSAPEKAAVKKGPVPKDQRSPESLACSAEADQKNLHGKERVSFRKKCMAAAKKAAKGGPAPAPAAATAPAAKK